MHHHIRLNADSTSTAPAQLPNAERKHRITEAWQTHLEGFPSQAMRPVIVHRLIFSMSKEQHDALVAVGINPNHVLHSSVEKVMRKFAEKFHPDDSIAFAYGLHHDRAHLHVHLALCPRTVRGRYVVSPRNLNANFISRLMVRRKPKLTPTVDKFAAVNRRSLWGIGDKVLDHAMGGNSVPPRSHACRRLYRAYYAAAWSQPVLCCSFFWFMGPFGRKIFPNSRQRWALP